jgi:hypothetical protein
LTIVVGGRDGCRPYSFDITCGTPCSPIEFDHNEQRRSCVRECQKGYYKYTYEDDKDNSGTVTTHTSESNRVDNKSAFWNLVFKTENIVKSQKASFLELTLFDALFNIMIILQAVLPIRCILVQ